MTDIEKYLISLKPGDDVAHVLTGGWGRVNRVTMDKVAKVTKLHIITDAGYKFRVSSGSEINRANRILEPQKAVEMDTEYKLYMRRGTLQRDIMKKLQGPAFEEIPLATLVEIARLLDA